MIFSRKDILSIVLIHFTGSWQVGERRPVDRRIKHVITRWNPFWNPTERFEPRTIEVHCEILEKFAGFEEEEYVWWGKITKSGNLGLTPAEIASINKQIFRGTEIHFYIYCPDKLLLHVGKLEEVSTLDFRNDPHAPAYYSEVPYDIAFWCKLSDIRKLDFQRFLNSHVLKEEDGKSLDTASAGGYYPRIIYEKPSQSFFNYGLTAGRKWFMKGGLGAMMPRCFKTGGMICTNLEAQGLESRHRVFIGMPFSSKLENVYKAAIKPALDSLGLTPWKANEEIQNIDLMCKVCGGIQICSSAIVDISDWNPNVLFELGLVYGLGKEALKASACRESLPNENHGFPFLQAVRRKPRSQSRNSFS